MPPTSTTTTTAPTSVTFERASSPELVVRPPTGSRARAATGAHTMQLATWIVSPLWAAAAVLGLVGLLAVAGLGFATHIGLGEPRSVIPTTHAAASSTATTISRLVSPPIELVTADISSAAHPACVCSSPYVGAVTGPPIVENGALGKLVDSLWRPGAATGDGSTFDAVEYEATTGQLVGGTTHFQKLAEAWQNPTKLMKTQDLSESDQVIASELDERFLQATVEIERNPLTAMEANLRAGKSPISGFSNAAMDAADPELAAEDESIEPLLEDLAVAAEDAAAGDG
jgi:hypothetical protein